MRRAAGRGRRRNRTCQRFAPVSARPRRRRFWGCRCIRSDRAAATPRQLAIEGQLGCAVDQAVLAERLTSPSGREPVRALAALPYGREMAPLAIALIRQTAPLLAQATNPDDYNRIAAVKLDPRVWQLRSAALDGVMGAPDGPRTGPPHPLLVAVALSARIEELEGIALPVRGRRRARAARQTDGRDRTRVADGAAQSAADLARKPAVRRTRPGNSAGVANNSTGCCWSSSPTASSMRR